MRERAMRLFPTHRQACRLALLWMLCMAGLYVFCGMTVRTLCGGAFAAVLVWLAFLDVRDGMLYDCITLPFALVGTLLSAAGFLVPLHEALMGGALCGVLFYCLHILSHGGMGGGDVKLVLGLGLWLGWKAAAVALWAAFLLGGTAAAILLLTGRKGRRDGLPFGPCLACGGYLGFLGGDLLWRLYWGAV